MANQYYDGANAYGGRGGPKSGFDAMDAG